MFALCLLLPCLTTSRTRREKELSSVFPMEWRQHVHLVSGRKSLSVMRRLATRPNVGLWVVENGVARCLTGACNPDWHWEVWARDILPEAARRASLSRPVYFLLHGWDEPLSPYPPGCLGNSTEAWFKHVLENPHGVLETRDASQAVILSPAIINGCHREILFPYGEEVQGEDERAQSDHITHTPWESRFDVLGWRGSGTGNGGAENHRLRTVQRVLADMPDADVYFHENPVGNFNASLVKSRIPFSHFAQYKYLLDLGGNSYSRRLPRLGQLNATLVLFHAYSDLATLVLRPHIDYIPILSVESIAPVVRMLRSRGTYARWLGRNARSRLRKALSPLSLQRYTRFVLEHLDQSCTFDEDGTTGSDVKHNSEAKHRSATKT
jgi:hypothetical protein